MRGKVKMFNQEKGYGFITLEDGKDVFFHYSQLMMEGFKTIDADAEVEFEVVETDRGLQAHNIVKAQKNRMTVIPYPWLSQLFFLLWNRYPFSIILERYFLSDRGMTATDSRILSYSVMTIWDTMV